MSIIIIFTNAHVYKWSHWIRTANEKGYSTSQRASLCDISASALSRIAFSVCIRETLLSTFTSQPNIRSLCAYYRTFFLLYVASEGYRESIEIPGQYWTASTIITKKRKDTSRKPMCTHSVFLFHLRFSRRCQVVNPARSCRFLINGFFSQIGLLLYRYRGRSIWSDASFSRDFLERQKYIWYEILFLYKTLFHSYFSKNENSQHFYIF